VGVSTCLLGENVRYDGGHKRDRYLTEVVAPYVTWVPVCPEVECGLPIPRESMRLVGDPASPRLVMPKSGRDQTERMRAWTGERLDQLATERLDGFVFKKNSPSSGAFRVKVYDENGMPQRVGSGLFAGALMARFPHLPVEEEGRLHDRGLRANFIERLFVHHCWARLLEVDPSPGGLVRFHTAFKLALMAHSPQHYRELGSLVAQAGSLPWDELTATYYPAFMEGFKTLSTPGRHANVLQHLMGFLKSHLSAEDKAELLDLIEAYRTEIVPLVVPVTLLNHHLARYPVPDWVHQQFYLRYWTQKRTYILIQSPGP
jgi:uncharacterized protein YbgA (DUF1722 family)/uncharacterized protein YbbK (DUF523 family)